MIARVILIIVGNPSGTAATIRATHTVNAVLAGSIDSKNGINPEVSTLSIPLLTDWNIININNKDATALDTLAIIPPKLPSFICRGVSSSGSERC